MKITLFILGFLTAFVVQYTKVWTFSNQFTNPVPTEHCAQWDKHIYFDTEHWNFDMHWTCGRTTLTI